MKAALAVLVLLAFSAFIVSVLTSQSPGMVSVPVNYSGKARIEVVCGSVSKMVTGDTVLDIPPGHGEVRITSRGAVAVYGYQLTLGEEAYWFLNDSPVELSGTGLSEAR